MQKPEFIWLGAFLAILILAGGAASAGGEDPAALYERVRAAARRGDLPEALELVTRAITAAPERPEGWMLRAQLHTLREDHGKAAADYGEVLKLDPKAAGAWQRRGEAHFRNGEIAKSIADFDRYLALSPAEKPHHWQRGISLYYAGRFTEGKQQFELHQTVNTQDVENAVWHYLCTARAESLAAARKQLIPIDGDPRIPMAQVHRLFAGKATPKEVIAAAEAGPERTRAGEPLFYAHLYLGLYFEAAGDEKKAREHILKAAARAKANGYMGDVARVHAGMLRQKGTR